MRTHRFSWPLLLSCTLAACGGGSAGGGAAGVSSGAALADLALNTAGVVDGTASIDLVQTWNQWVSTGFKRNGTLGIYGQRDLGTVALNSVIENLDPVLERTTLLVTQSQHGIYSGDQVTLSGVTGSPHGLNKSWFETTHTVTVKNDNQFWITLPVLATGSASANFSSRVKYRFLECTGSQLMEQGPARAQTPALRFNGYDALEALSFTTTRLSSCSPAETTYNAHLYFKDAAGLKSWLGQDIEGGSYSAVDSFVLPSGALQSGASGTIGALAIYTDNTRRQLDARTQLSYQVLRHTAQSVFLQMKSQTYETTGALRVTQTDLYGKDPVATTESYVLLRTRVQYNNARQTEVVIDYTADLTQLQPSILSGSGALQGVPTGTHQWQFFPIDVTPFKFGGTLQVEISLGSGASGASYDLFTTSSPSLTAEGRPLGSLAHAYDVAPGSKTTLTYTFTNNKIKTLYLAIEGNWGSPTTATNTFSFEGWVKE